MATRSRGVIRTLTGPWISAKIDVPEDGSNSLDEAARISKQWECEKGEEKKRANNR